MLSAGSRGIRKSFDFNCRRQTNALIERGFEQSSKDQSSEMPFAGSEGSAGNAVYSCRLSAGDYIEALRHGLRLTPSEVKQIFSNVAPYFSK
jgi:hypothetical protein